MTLKQLAAAIVASVILSAVLVGSTVYCSTGGNPLGALDYAAVMQHRAAMITQIDAIIDVRR